MTVALYSDRFRSVPNSSSLDLASKLQTLDLKMAELNHGRWYCFVAEV